MPAESGSPALLGRERERAELVDALTLALDGRPQTVLVGGDAGIGKTTLVTDLARRAEELGFTVALGHCLDIEAGISFGAVIEAVRALLAGLEDLESRPVRAADAHPAGPGGADGVRSRFRVLEDLRLTVLEAAAAGPVLLVLEDMHWADRSTQDFAVALSRTAPRAAAASCSPSAATTCIAGTRPGRRWPRSAGSPGPDASTSVRWTGTASPASWRRCTGGPPTRRWSGRCWRGRRATRSTPRRSPPPARERSPTSCPTCSWPGSTR